MDLSSKSMSDTSNNKDIISDAASEDTKVSENVTNELDNENYKLIMSAITVLQNQLNIARSNLETLEKMKQEALNNPYEFVQQIKFKRYKPTPKLQKIISIPSPEGFFNSESKNFQKLPLQSKNILRNDSYMSYATKIQKKLNNAQSLVQQQQQIPPPLQSSNLTYLTNYVKNKIGSSTINQLTADHHKYSTPSSPTSSSSPANSPVNSPLNINSVGNRQKSLLRLEEFNYSLNDNIEDEDSVSNIELEPKKKKMKIASSASSTFGALWSREEQDLLDKLLEKYPDDGTNKRDRLDKIANEFGTRTKKQIYSRLQKIKNTGTSEVKKKVISGAQYMYAPTVKMTNEDLDELMADSDISSVHSGSDAEIDEKLLGTEDYKELKKLQNLVKANKGKKYGLKPVHHGFKCDLCETEPILGVKNYERFELKFFRKGIHVKTVLKGLRLTCAVNVLINSTPMHFKAAPFNKFYEKADEYSYLGY
ncbi:ZZ-type zinc finger-containing protein 3 [Clydaea vesicula]|uniref:ZZ-type zinc finger-containing protein 3 n=1 Tax=Clydaea vesicula TaxID=447962 RepID=A0AAD5U595_9FUNG|nr:ZZ-type zinc finger-containing protein 3 [Clydaea vesicula]